MELFSDRIGITSSVRSIQLNDIDKPLLNGLWNVYSSFVLDSIEPSINDRSLQDNFVLIVWHNLFREPYDTAPYYFDKLKAYLRTYFFSTDWYNVYNIIQFGLETPYFNIKSYIESVNNILEREYSGYRFINDLIVPISNSIETDAIEEAMNVTQFTFDGHANIHLSNALKSISDKPNPDYRNSVKEAISAVGSIVRKITGKNSFGEGIKYLEQHGLKLNSQFKEGLNKFYNYTNDPSTGIRHEIISAPQPPDFETAKFMLLSCSAFINYIVPLAQKANVNL